MKHEAKHPLSHYYYDIKDENIARQPAEPRDHAKLLVYDTEKDEIHIDIFRNLVHYLPQDSLMVLNNTGVIPARVFFVKDTGGRVEGLILYNEGVQPDGTIPVIVNKQIHVGRTIHLGDYSFEIRRQNQQYFYLFPLFDIQLLPTILLDLGTTPTPRYLGNISMPEDDLRSRYQTIFAEEKKSVAAPTASLHFTEEVFQSLKTKNISQSEVTLHVGMGTFAEISQSNLDQKILHTEPIEISEKTISAIYSAKNNRNPVIAVGTTAIRTLESQADILLSGSQSAIRTQTNIFILPGFEYKIADILITNFHIPQSSLMALVDAFLLNKKSKKTILDLYRFALDNDFKFYSFGDSMVVL